jgi:hypothetical protein
VTGEFKGHPSGPFEMNDEVFGECCKNFRQRGLPLAFDYEHASEQDPTSGTIPTSGAHACGWIHDLVNRGPDGLWGLVEWLDDARDAIKAGKYAYVSPALRLASKDAKTGKAIGARISSAALTNQPFLSQLPPLIAASDKVRAPTKDAHPTRFTLKTQLMATLPGHATATRPSCRALHDACDTYMRCLDDEEQGDGDVSMKLRDLEGNVARSVLLLRSANATIATQDAELVALRDDKAKRDERDLVEEVDIAFRTHCDQMKYGPADRALLLSWRRSDPESFRARHPRIDREHAHLLRDLAGENPRPQEPVHELSEAEEIQLAQRTRGLSFSDAQIYVADGRHARRRRAAAAEGWAG